MYVMGRNERREREGNYFQEFKGHKDDGLPSLPAGILKKTNRENWEQAGVSKMRRPSAKVNRRQFMKGGQTGNEK